MLCQRHVLNSGELYKIELHKRFAIGNLKNVVMIVLETKLCGGGGGGHLTNILHGRGKSDPDWMCFLHSEMLSNREFFFKKRTIYICIGTENVICKLCELCT